MNKGSFCIILLFISFLSFGGGIRDENKILSDQEIAELELLCEQLYHRHKLQVYIYLLDEGQKEPTYL